VAVVRTTNLANFGSYFGLVRNAFIAGGKELSRWSLLLLLLLLLVLLLVVWEGILGVSSMNRLLSSVVYRFSNSLLLLVLAGLVFIVCCF